MHFRLKLFICLPRGIFFSWDYLSNHIFPALFFSDVEQYSHSSLHRLQYDWFAKKWPLNFLKEWLVSEIGTIFENNENFRAYFYDCCGVTKTSPSSNPLATYEKEISLITKTQ